MLRRDNALFPPRTLRLLSPLCVISFLLLLAGCGRRNASGPSSLTFLIESNPTNLDPRIDALVDQIRMETDRQKRKALYSEVQKILADDLPYLPLWFTDVVSVHRRPLADLPLSPTGDFDFLTALRTLR
jgi:ABC-type transport system substrate-binding protein